MDAEKRVQAFTPEETLELAAALPSDVIRAEALRRGIELPIAAGVMAVDGTIQDTEQSVDTFLRVDKDVVETAPDTKESLREQFTSAYVGYLDVTKILNEGRKTEDQVEVADAETVANELEVWLTDERLAYVAAVQEADSSVRFTLVATANVVASADEVIELNRKCGDGQPGVGMFDVMLSDTFRKYKSEEVSGTNPANGNSVQFKLVPTKSDPEMYGTVAFQKAKLADVQADYPFLDDTSPLEDAAHNFTLAQDDKLVGPRGFEATYHRNIKVTPEPVGGQLKVPASDVFIGQPLVLVSKVGDDKPGRVSVG